MGYSYTFSGALCCDNCGKSGRVRKFKCPAGWCQAAALCPACKKSVTVPHTHCAANAAESRALRDLEEAIVNSGGALRCSAMNVDGDRTQVLFRTATGTIGYYMPRAAYSAIPLRQPATPDDYRQHGELTPAPSSYY